MKQIQKHLTISGKVQGVGFRAFVLRNAREAGVNGWVKNTYDGRVEVIFAGNKSQVNKMINMVNQGPRWARVEKVDVKDEPYNENLTGFHINY